MNVFTEWQDVLIVLQQDNTLARGAQRDPLMFRRVHNLCTAVSIFNIRMIEDAEQELHSQHVAHSVIERLHRNPSFFDQLAQR